MIASVPTYEYQAPVVLNQTNPTQNDWYDILPTTSLVGVYDVAVAIEDVNETLEVQAIVDGETIAAVGKAATHSTNYYVRTKPDAVNRIDTCELDSWANRRHGKYFIFEGQSVQIQVRKTTAAGTGNLKGIVMHGVLKNA